MHWTRRELLATGAGSLLGLGVRAEPSKDAPRSRMGVVIHSYGLRRAADTEHAFDDPLTFLDYCRTLGAGGAQTSLGVRDDAYAAKVHELLTKHQLYLEGSIALPRDKADVDRFTDEVRTVKRCGADLFRTVQMNGRRYEVFDGAEAYRKFREQAREALALARPVIEKHEVRMAVENHKDLQGPELLDLIKKLDSPSSASASTPATTSRCWKRPKKRWSCWRRTPSRATSRT